MSLPAGALIGKPFESLILGVDSEIFPFVRFGGLCTPIGLREATVCLEQALFELARRVLPTEKDRGDLFEAVITGCLAQSAPPDVRPLQGPLSIAIPGTADPGEVDFAAQAEGQVLFVGEAKAYFVTKGDTSVINAFSDQVGKAIAQLARRLEALRLGSPLSVNNGSRVRIGAQTKIMGLAVPLHSYAGAVWNLDTLREVKGDNPDLAVIPLHQLVLLMQTMTSAADLALYLQLRAAVIASGTRVMDEADLLFLHLTGRYGDLVARVRQAAAGDADVILRGFSISPYVAVGLPRPQVREVWRLLFRSICHPE